MHGLQGQDCPPGGDCGEQSGWGRTLQGRSVPNLERGASKGPAAEAPGSPREPTLGVFWGVRAGDTGGAGRGPPGAQGCWAMTPSALVYGAAWRVRPRKAGTCTLGHRGSVGRRQGVPGAGVASVPAGRRRRGFGIDLGAGVTGSVGKGGAGGLSRGKNEGRGSHGPRAANGQRAHRWPQNLSREVMCGRNAQALSPR